jgi:hypothetical protein
LIECLRAVVIYAGEGFFVFWEARGNEGFNPVIHLNTSPGAIISFACPFPAVFPKNKIKKSWTYVSSYVEVDTTDYMSKKSGGLKNGGSRWFCAVGRFF